MLDITVGSVVIFCRSARTTNLGSKGGAVVLQAQRLIAAEGRTVIVVTHNLGVAVADQITRLHARKALATGPATKALDCDRHTLR